MNRKPEVWRKAYLEDGCGVVLKKTLHAASYNRSERTRHTILL